MSIIIPHSSFRRYLAVIGCAVMVFALAVGALATVAKRFGAFNTVSEIATLQHQNPAAIFLPFDLRYNAAFKVARVRLYQPDVVWFSTSRAGEATADMFRPYRFYNMSFTSWTIEQLKESFERVIAVSNPLVAIISLDYFLFTPDWERGYSTSRKMIFDSQFRFLQASLGNFVRTAINNTERLRSYLHSPTDFVGTQSIISQEGFRADGSYLYSAGHIASSRREYLTADCLVNSMPGAPKMYSNPITQITEMASLAKERGITLVAVQLPFIRSGVDFLDNNAEYRPLSGVWREFESESTRAWLAGLNVPFFDLSRSSIDDNLDNFIDAYHLGENGMQLAVKELKSNPEFHALLPKL
jgi:hypothetical protein